MMTEKGLIAGIMVGLLVGLLMKKLAFGLLLGIGVAYLIYRSNKNEDDD